MADPSPSRRDFLRAAGAGGAALALGCGEPESDDLAVAILEPSSDALLVSIWAPGVREATITVRTDAGAVTHAVPIAASGTGALDLTGLAPSAVHEITAHAGERRSGPYRARTAPRDDDGRRIRIAIAADLDPHPAFESDLPDHVAGAAPELLVALGDYPYADNPPAALDEAAYRARHAALRTSRPALLLHQAMGVRAIYDDHEIANDWDARFAAAEPARLAAGLAVWDEFFPVRDAGAAGDVRYRRWRWGAHAECFLLDCRRFRDASDAPDGFSKTMLGDAQRAWLTEGVAGSAATFKLVFTSVPLDFGNTGEDWSAYTTERQRIFDALLGIPGVVFFSADQHWFAAHRHRYGIREFQFGPLARDLRPSPPAMPGVLFRAHAFNAGLVDIDGDELTVAAIGPGGARLYETTLTAAELTPRL